MLLAEQRLDDASIITALLHDTIEDTLSTYSEIALRFGEEIAQLVDGVTKLTNLELSSVENAQAENFRKLLMAMSKDLRVLLVKLADRLHNMRTIKHLPPDKQQRKARETMDIFAPLAGRMGMQWMRDELEDIGFRVLNPEARKSIIRRFVTLRRESGDVIAKITEDIRTRAGRRPASRPRCSGARRSPIPIWRKMEEKKEGFSRLSDIYGFRIITRIGRRLLRGARRGAPALGGGAGPVQGLHQPAEVERLPLDPHHGLGARRQARRGADPHRRDARGGRDRRGGALVLQGRRALREPVRGRSVPVAALDHRALRGAGGLEDFLEHVKLEMFQDQVFCFTPKGDVVKLPRGATPIDFAYAIHTRIGDSCVGAKVDGQRVPLWTKLRNGQSVTIIRAEGQRPQPSWEDMVVTGRAKAAIRRSLARRAARDPGPARARDRPRRARAGRQEGDRQGARGRGPAPRARGGRGRAGPARRRGDDRQGAGRDALSRAAARRGAAARAPTSTAPVVIGLDSGQVARPAPCCNPIPGERIVGIAVRGKGVMIHAIDCAELVAFEDTPDRWIDLRWAEGQARARCTSPASR